MEQCTLPSSNKSLQEGSSEKVNKIKFQRKNGRDCNGVKLFTMIQLQKMVIVNITSFFTYYHETSFQNLVIFSNFRIL
jgi:hypothetical protein